ncbi:hypothetical protein [Streptomyces sp. NPDC046161]|uniref:hypothetical protein n=1 Tax=Streptomyces sp. NPDC046161 TaxID=3155132 RepID=UPI0034087ABC
MTVRPPLVGAALWTAVMKTAEDRCECRGACGKKHDPDRTRQQQRCPVRNGDHLSRVGLVVLIATPRDPINEGDFATAAQLPAKRLAAMCRPCHDAVLRKIRAAVKKLPVGDELFDSSAYYVAPSSKKQADVGAA